MVPISIKGQFDAALDYIERHELYIPALRLWSHQADELKVSVRRRLKDVLVADRTQSVLGHKQSIYVLYGEDLLQKRQYSEAAHGTSQPIKRSAILLSSFVNIGSLCFG